MIRHYTRRPFWKRFMSNSWLLAFVIVTVLLLLPALAEAALTAIGAGYDPRIGVPA